MLVEFQIKNDTKQRPKYKINKRLAPKLKIHFYFIPKIIIGFIVVKIKSILPKKVLNKLLTLKYQ